MLALTPAPLQTAGERSVFAELTRWDTGGSVRAAVMASIPMADGVSRRRVSDAVLFVPEGLAVVRIAEVLRQSGTVTASPEGAWTIDPESGPAQALQLSGGGSSPLDGLMRAGMDTAVKLRRAGLEPGRIARLTVLVGDLSGLVPADGDLGEGDQVALLEPRSLLLGIARAGRYAGVDNPRLWTTADVRAALEALGLEGRGPSVEELNGEGFPYSPYVLRRADLLAPAAMAAGASAAPKAPAAPLPDPPAAPPAPTPAGQAPVLDAVAGVGAASTATAQAAGPPRPVAPAVPVHRDTVAIDAPEEVAAQQAAPQQAAPEHAPPEHAAPRQDPPADAVPAAPDAGIGGLFAEPESSAPTAVFTASGPPPRTSVFPVQMPEQVPASPPVYWSQTAAATTPPAEEPEAPGSGRRTGLLVAAALVVVVLLLGVGGWLLLGGLAGDGEGTAAAESPAAAAASPGPRVGDVRTIGGLGYTVQAVDLTDTCAGHAYGAVADFFAATDCTGLSRALYSTDVAGEAVVVSVARVQMADATAARDLRALADQNGSGNVSDLLREGVRYEGSPAKLSGAEYASALSGATVTVVEAAWTDEDAELDAAEIDRVAGEALALEVLPFPGG